MAMRRYFSLKAGVTEGFYAGVGRVGPDKKLYGKQYAAIRSLEEHLESCEGPEGEVYDTAPEEAADAAEDTMPKTMRFGGKKVVDIASLRPEPPKPLLAEKDEEFLDKDYAGDLPSFHLQIKAAPVGAEGVDLELPAEVVQKVEELAAGVDPKEEVAKVKSVLAPVDFSATLPPDPALADLNEFAKGNPSPKKSLAEVKAVVGDIPAVVPVTAAKEVLAEKLGVPTKAVPPEAAEFVATYGANVPSLTDTYGKDAPPMDPTKVVEAVVEGSKLPNDGVSLTGKAVDTEKRTVDIDSIAQDVSDFHGLDKKEVVDLLTKSKEMADQAKSDAPAAAGDNQTKK